MLPRLGVNIDHVATLRQQRGESYPSLVDAARLCLKAGADQITIHLREDRRHIQDTDVGAIKLVTKEFGRPLNLEMGCNEEILQVALVSAPDWICLVPEKREERTTEGGLNLQDESVWKKVAMTCEVLKKRLPQTKISLFLEEGLETLQKLKGLSVDAVEIHTGDFARAYLNNDDLPEYLKKFARAKEFLREHKLACHAGHGLTIESVGPLLSARLFEEYNIGHWIICEAVLKGLGPVVEQLKGKFHESGKL